jgi:hypothetical protein
MSSRDARDLVVLAFDNHRFDRDLLPVSQGRVTMFRCSLPLKILLAHLLVCPAMGRGGGRGDRCFSLLGSLVRGRFEEGKGAGQEGRAEEPVKSTMLMGVFSWASEVRALNAVIS